jgi:zinc transport system substrate-binding protein
MILMTLWTTVRTSAGLLAAAVALSGCAVAPSATSAAGTGRMSIVVAAYPLQFLAERIAGDGATIQSLTAPGAEPHDVELTAKQVADVASADAVVYLSGFQAAVDQAVQTVQPKVAIDANTGLTLLPALPEAQQGGAGNNGATGGYDPHVWQSPADMVTMAQTISAGLSKARPDLAATFSTNTSALVGDLKALDESYRSGLANCQRTQFVTSHAAFAYLADRYHLVQIPIAGLDPTEEPTATRIAAVHELATRYGVTTIFFETLVSDTVAKSIAGDLGLKTAVLDPIEGITATSAGTNYLEVMKSNLSALQEANGCK